MRKNLKRMALLLLIAVVLIPMAVMTALASGNENLAQGKTATASSSYPGKPWTPDKAVDGDTSGSDSRWSSKRATGTTNEGDGDVGTKEQWLQIDLGTVTPVEQVNIYWEAAFATSYEIQTSLDGEEFQTVKECTATEAGAQSYRDLGVEEAQYIRIHCLEPKTAKYGYSIYEVEVFAENKMESAQDVLDALKGQAQIVRPHLRHHLRHHTRISRQRGRIGHHDQILALPRREPQGCRGHYCLSPKLL